MRGDPPQKTEFIYKKLCIYSYMFKLQSPAKYFSFDAIQDFFPTAQNNFWMCQFWCLLVLLLCFVSPLPPCQNSSLWGLISSREANKKITEGQIRWLGRVGHWGHAVFGQKLLATQHCVGRCTRNHPSWNEQWCWKSLQKIHWSQTQPLITPADALIQMGS